MDCKYLRGSVATDAAIIVLVMLDENGMEVDCYFNCFNFILTAWLSFDAEFNSDFKAGIIMYVSSFISLSKSQLATAGSDAAFIAFILRWIDSSHWELSNAGLSFQFGAVEVKFCCRRIMGSCGLVWSTLSRRFWRSPLANFRIQTTTVSWNDRGGREHHFCPLFKPIRSVEVEISPWFDFWGRWSKR